MATNNLLDIAIAKHKALQELCNHYNTINWSLHAIFIALNGLVLRWLGEVILSLSASSVKPAMIFIIIVAGALSVFTWWAIYKRHQFFIRSLYGELKITEQGINKMVEAGGKKANFDVHLALNSADHSKDSTTILRFRTNKIISFIQILFSLLYLAAFLFFWKIL